MGFLDSLEKLINEHGSAVILKERITLANDKYAALESENKVLRSENDALRHDIEKLGQQNRTFEERISNVSSLQNYINESGALFKKTQDGTYDKTPYCPACQTAMAAPGRHELFRCGKRSCGQLASFKSIQLGDILSRLP